jgi:hypothetical protein
MSFIVHPDAINRLFGITENKDLALISAPAEPRTRWSNEQRVYIAPWTIEKAKEAFRSLRIAFIDEQEFVSLVLPILADYDKALSKAEYDLYICQSAKE